LPLPGQLLSLQAAEGQRLLANGASRADYSSLAATFESQRRPAYCGVATSVAVLNALRRSGARLTQHTFITDLPTELRVTFSGMTLDELGALIRRHGAEVEVVHAQDTTLDAFRAKARENLGREGDYVVVNYERGLLGQRKGGHISPLAAYSAASDRFLILDVAAHKYPPVWASTSDLWNAINTVDSESGTTRGFVLVRDRAPSS
jgi:hypothetical protein